jgi:F-type H+-transporting ATPase subunit beta
MSEKFNNGNKEKNMAKEVKNNQGEIIQIVGVVVDAEFSKDGLPAINDALTVAVDKREITLEVAQHLSETTVRAIALSSTDGLERGAKVTATGSPISVPVGPETQGRMFNVTGEPIDGKAAPQSVKTMPIHRDPPPLVEQSNKTEILETGI